MTSKFRYRYCEWRSDTDAMATSPAATPKSASLLGEPPVAHWLQSPNKFKFYACVRCLALCTARGERYVNLEFPGSGVAL